MTNETGTALQESSLSHLETPVFTAADRCDACTARAKAKVILSSGGELIFCGHHTEKYRAALASQGAMITESSPE